jgi:Na+/melibiose symporter-like transporter
MPEIEDSKLKRASGTTGRLVLEIAAAVLIGAGVPLLWVWIGSLIQASRDSQRVEGTTAVIMVVGILASYVIVLMIASAIQARSQAAEDQAPARYPWNRSMRDEPYRPGTQKLSPVEAVFVGTAVVASIAMLIWFFAFAGSPLPT